MSWTLFPRQSKSRRASGRRTVQPKSVKPAVEQLEDRLVPTTTPTLTWAAPAAITYGTPLGATQLDTTAGVPGTFVYTPGAGTDLGTGLQTLQVIFTPTDTADYATVSASVKLAVDPATPTNLVATPGNADVSLDWTASAGASAYALYRGTSSGSETQIAYGIRGTSFTDTGLNDNLGSGHALTNGTTYYYEVRAVSANETQSGLSNQASATPEKAPIAPTGLTASAGNAQVSLNWAPAAGATSYDIYRGTSSGGETLLASGVATTSYTSTGLTNGSTYYYEVSAVNAGGQSALSSPVSATPQAGTPTLTWATPAAITYGTALSAAQLDASASVPGTFAYAPAAGTVLGAGTHTLTVTFTPTDSADYTTATDSVTLTVNPATPTLTWATPAAIIYGTALDAAQLDASASVPGAFVYTPAAGTVLGAGTHTLSVTFTPTDSTDYTTATDSVSLTVNPATPTLTWATPAPITSGTALSAAQLDATANVPGTFVYAPGAGTVLAAGTQVLTVTFTPTDSTDYTTATDSVTLTVTPLSVTDWFSQNLPDPGLQNLARNDFTKDGSITDGDMVGLLNQAVAEGTVTSAVFTSLQNLVSASGASYLQEAADVQNLGYKLVDGDPSNTYYQGNIPLGNLKVGSSASQLQELTNKWFLGMDHPLDPGMPAWWGGTLSYLPASGTLFGSSGAPQYTDVEQGEEGDCWFMASLASLANSTYTTKGQADIESQFTYEGAIGANGAEVWSVRFYHNGVAQYLTVDNCFPTLVASTGGNDIPFYAGMNATLGAKISDPSNVLWAALEEKAYAQLCASGWNGRSPTDSYGSLSGGLARTDLPIITGSSTTDASCFGSEAAFISAMQSGTFLTFATSSNPISHFVGGHDYAVISVSGSGSTALFQLYNPWGPWSFVTPPAITWAQLKSGSFGLDGNTVVNSARIDFTPAGPSLAAALPGDAGPRKASNEASPIYLADSSLPPAPADTIPVESWYRPLLPGTSGETARPSKPITWAAGDSGLETVAEEGKLPKSLL